MNTRLRVQEKAVSTDPVRSGDVSVSHYRFALMSFNLFFFYAKATLLFSCSCVGLFIFIFSNRFCTLLSARLRRLSGASHPGGVSQPQSHIHQGGYLRGETEMEHTAKVTGATVGGEKLEKQTQTRVRRMYMLRGGGGARADCCLFCRKVSRRIIIIVIGF